MEQFLKKLLRFPCNSMAQGKLKVKAKVPNNAGKKKNNSSVKKGKVTKKASKKNNPQAQLTAKFQKNIHKKINANIVSELAARAQRVEEGKSFFTIESELRASGGGKKKK